MHPIAIHAANPGPSTGAGNWTWLIPGRDPTLIDAGVGEPRHIEALAAALGGAALAQVLVTHAHVDHAAGAPAIAAQWPGVGFRKMPWPERDTRWPVVWEPIADGDRLGAGDTQLTAVHTPGHAPDHLCFWHEDTRTLFGGDLLIKGTTVYIPASLQGDLAAYLASLERVLALEPARILPAHGPVIDEPARLLRGYLDHRRAREAQIVDVLSRGAADPDVLVARVYGPLGPRVRSVARETVLAHLQKLERDGRVERQGERWHIMEP